MFSVRFVCLVLAAACLLCAGFPVLAAEVDCDAAYCFTVQDFSPSSDPLTGICVTALPTGSGTLFLGNRLVQPGDILTAGQLEQMTFQPITTQSDAQATVSYLPIYENRVEPQAQMTLSIRGKEDLAPIARDSTLETYRNLSNDDTLRVSDPEGKALTYSLVRAPRRGDVELRDDGSFTYTPKKNKVGVDSFTFTAADPAGNVSREATVTIQILKPSMPVSTRTPQALTAGLKRSGSAIPVCSPANRWIVSLASGRNRPSPGATLWLCWYAPCRFLRKIPLPPVRTLTHLSGCSLI